MEDQTRQVNPQKEYYASPKPVMK